MRRHVDHILPREEALEAEQDSRNTDLPVVLPGSGQQPTETPERAQPHPEQPRPDQPHNQETNSVAQPEQPTLHRSQRQRYPPDRLQTWN